MGIKMLLPSAYVLVVLVTCLAQPADGDFVISHFSVDYKEKLPSDEQPKVAAVQFAFAKHFQSHMVLQQAPQRANIYGFSPNIAAEVIVQLTTPGQVYNYSTVVKQSNTSGVGVWSVTLDPVKTGGSVSITAESKGQTLLLEDVLYGDVWVCSGQSNMEFMVQQIFYAADVIANSTRYPYVRFMDVYRQDSPKPLDDLIAVRQNWTSPTHASVASFSAVCWLYGIALYEALGYPIGLVGTDYGGSPVEAWSSPAALAKCGINVTDASASILHQMVKSDDPLFNGPDDNSALWNAMVRPLLGMTIYGVIWYQGEGDSEPDTLMNRYNCTFPAMIDDWRLSFSKASFGQTGDMFPFGFVQLAPSMPPQNPGFTDIRWHQTADIGYVPNRRLQNVFMAVTLDLPDFDSASGPVHTRYKLEVGFRLSLSGLAVAYGRKEMFQGPFPFTATLVSNSTLIINYGSQWQIDVRNTEGFELLCTSGNHSPLTWWLPTSITYASDTQITLLASICGEGQQIRGIRYAWQTTPCALKTCAVYSTINQLPAPPFVTYADLVNGMPVFKFHK